MRYSLPNAIPNDSTAAGRRASRSVFGGPFKRFALYAIHTRFDAVQWIVQDAEITDDVTGEPVVIRQIDDADEALREFKRICVAAEDAGWQVGGGGTEPITPYEGKRWQYMWNRYTGDHAYYCFEDDCFYATPAWDEHDPYRLIS